MKNQRGFTLIELMISAAAAGVVMVAAGGFLVRALGWHDELNARLEMNRHAREAYRVLAYGGTAATNGNDGTKNVYGVRGLKTAPASGMRYRYAFRYSSNNLTLTPDRLAAMSVTCTGTKIPLPDCGIGTMTVEGWIGDDVQIHDNYSVNDATVEIELPVISPYLVRKAKNPGAFADTYRAIFSLNLTEGGDDDDGDDD